MRTAVRASILIWASALGACPAEPAAEAYVRDLRSSVPSVRGNAAVTLGRLADKSAVPALMAALKDPEKEVRREAAKALGAIKDGRAVTPLMDALYDRDANVRMYAAYALGEIKDPKATSALLRVLGDPEYCVRDQAAWALREQHDWVIDVTLVAALKGEDPDLAHIIWLLRSMGSTSAPGLLGALLKEPKALVRLRAVQTLAELGDKEAVDPLLSALTDADPSVRRSAIEALTKLGDDRAEKPLKALLALEKDPSVREATEKALAVFSREGDLMAYWSFDDQDTKVAKDLTGHGSDGQIKGCEPAEGKVGRALRFAKGKYVALGKPAGVRIGNAPFTVMAWVKSEAKNGVVLAKGGAYCGFSLYLLDGVPRFGIHLAQDKPAQIAVGTEQAVGSWVHLAGVVKNDHLELYVNGRLAATATTDGYIPGECGQGMEIGFDEANSPCEITDSFEGIIDEVKAYSTALSEEEIAEQVAVE
jgi:HEAT repeat protein